MYISAGIVSVLGLVAHVAYLDSDLAQRSKFSHLRVRLAAKALMETSPFGDEFFFEALDKQRRTSSCKPDPSRDREARHIRFHGVFEEENVSLPKG